MKVKVINDDKAFEVEITEELYKMLEKSTVKKTGYELADPFDPFYSNGSYDIQEHDSSFSSAYTSKLYETANYYTSESVARNNLRADILNRQLRRFAVEHRSTELDWDDPYAIKYCIYYDHEHHILDVSSSGIYQTAGTVYFDSIKVAQDAMDEFHEELIWYFHDYRDSL